MQEEIKKYAKLINEGKIDLKVVLGAYGDIDNCTGLAVEEIFPEEGGAYIKLLGTSYLMKTCPFGVIPISLMELYGLAKRIITKPLMDLQKDKVLILVFLFYYLFRKKKLLKYINEYIDIIHNKVLGVIPPDTKRFNKFQKELRRVNNKIFETEKDPYNLRKLFELVIYLTDFDTAYKYPAQDTLGEIKKNPPIKEFKRLCRILEERYNDAECKRKSKALRKLSIIFYHPYFYKLLKRFLEEINPEEVKLDKEDYYFCLKRYLFNFKGKTLEERKKEAEEIDKKEGNIKVDVNFTNLEIYG